MDEITKLCIEVACSDDNQVNLVNTIESILEEEIVADGFKFLGGFSPVQKSTSVFNELVLSHYSTPGKFKEDFRMEPGTFKELCTELRSLHKETSTIPLEKKLLMALWFLGHKDCYRRLSYRFEVSIGTAHYVISEMVDLICQLKDKYIKWPTPENLVKISNSFAAKSNIPNIIGAVDTIDINIKPPKTNSLDFKNSQGTYSIKLQGICDNNLFFTDVFIGLPGRMEDCDIWKISPIFSIMRASSTKHQHLVGDSAYPLSHFIMRPYSDLGHLTKNQLKFNCALNCSLFVIDKTFQLLKGKWQRLEHLDINLHKYIIKTVCACCILHNFVLLFEGFEGFFENSDLEISKFNNKKDVNNEASRDGILKRDFLATSLRVVESKQDRRC